MGERTGNEQWAAEIARAFVGGDCVSRWVYVGSGLTEMLSLRRFGAFPLAEAVRQIIVTESTLPPARLDMSSLTKLCKGRDSGAQQDCVPDDSPADHAAIQAVWERHKQAGTVDRRHRIDLTTDPIDLTPASL